MNAYPRTSLDPSHPSPSGHKLIADLIYHDLVAVRAGNAFEIDVRLGGRRSGLAPSPESDVGCPSDN